MFKATIAVRYPEDAHPGITSEYTWDTKADAVREISCLKDHLGGGKVVVLGDRGAWIPRDYWVSKNS